MDNRRTSGPGGLLGTDGGQDAGSRADHPTGHLPGRGWWLEWEALAFASRVLFVGMAAMAATGYGLRAWRRLKGEARRHDRETYTRPDMDRAIERRSRLGFGNALAEVDGDLLPFGHGGGGGAVRRVLCWRTRRPSFRTAAIHGLRRRLSRLWKPSRNTRSVDN